MHLVWKWWDNCCWVNFYTWGFSSPQKRDPPQRLPQSTLTLRKKAFSWWSDRFRFQKFSKKWENGQLWNWIVPFRDAAAESSDERKDIDLNNFTLYGWWNYYPDAGNIVLQICEKFRFFKTWVKWAGSGMESGRSDQSPDPREGKDHQRLEKWYECRWFLSSLSATGWLANDLPGLPSGDLPWLPSCDRFWWPTLTLIWWPDYGDLYLDCHKTSRLPGQAPSPLAPAAVCHHGNTINANTKLKITKSQILKIAKY